MLNVASLKSTRITHYCSWEDKFYNDDSLSALTDHSGAKYSFDRRKIYKGRKAVFYVHEWMFYYCVICIVGCFLFNVIIGIFLSLAMLVAQLIETFDYHSSAPTHVAQEKYRR